MNVKLSYGLVIIPLTFAVSLLFLKGCLDIHMYVYIQTESLDLSVEVLRSGETQLESYGVHRTSKTFEINASDLSKTHMAIDLPKCFYPNCCDGNSYYITMKNNTSLGFQAVLKLNQSKPNMCTESHTLMMDVRFEENYRLRVKISDPQVKRFEVPVWNLPEPTRRASRPSYIVETSDVLQPFYLAVLRVDNGTKSVVFSTRGMSPLVFSDQYLQISSILSSHNIYGLGEHRTGIRLNVNNTRFTMWNVDHRPKENSNLYGSHPFYIALDDGHKADGFFLLNSNAMDVILDATPSDTWRTIGGILDFYIFIGRTPGEIVQHYTEVIGQPAMPPYWGLGFHICRFGYRSVDEVMKVVDRVRKAGIPQDTQWTDDDYMVDAKDFTTDTARFGNQSALVQKLHDRGMHYVIIVDPGISNNVTSGPYPPYDLGIKMDIFIKNTSGMPLIGKVWPGTTVFVDFSNPLSQQYWTTLVGDFHEIVPVDGLWIDMNELSNFVNGSVDGCPNTAYDNPPYLPGVAGGSLYAFTICSSAVQNISLSYNMHNLYGLLEAKVTYQSLKEVRGKRPFVISRSTFSGQGHYGGHWGGDNSASFHDMYRSISAMLVNGLMGIPLYGDDICGFNSNTTYELCLRWYQLGAFYPFSRSHNEKSVIKDQDPGAFDDFFASVVRKVYLIRYSILPYIYSLFSISHVTGDPVARAMMYEFPDDPQTYDMDTQFMLGPALLIVPVVTENARIVTAYLPTILKPQWYSFYTGEIIQYSGFTQFEAPLDHINLFWRGGFIIPMQEPALTTTESRANDFSLVVTMDTQDQAEGFLYWDDGDSIDPIERGEYNNVHFRFDRNMLMSNVTVRGFPTQMLLRSIVIYGVTQDPSVVHMNNISQYFQYNINTKVLQIPALDPKVDLLHTFVLTL